jgi:hypothetical protein
METGRCPLPVLRHNLPMRKSVNMAGTAALRSRRPRSARRESLSEFVGLHTDPDPSKRPPDPRILKRLRGILKGVDLGDYREEYRKHLAVKYLK